MSEKTDPKTDLKTDETNGESNNVTNSDVKSHPLFTKLTSELARLKQSETEREQAEAESQRLKEIEDAKARGEFETTLKKINDENEALKKSYEQKITETELKYKLSVTGFSERGVDLLQTEFDKEKFDSIDDYVKGCAENEDNKIFMIDAQSRTVPKPPANTPGGGKSFDSSKLMEMEKSTDLKIRKQARDYIRAYYTTHGKLPE